MKKVLLVGENKMVRSALEEVLRSGEGEAEYEISHSSGSREALELLLSDLSAFDIMVVDSLLKDTDGITFCKELQERGIAVLKILLLERGDDASINEALIAGANDFIVKDDAGEYIKWVPPRLKKVWLTCEHCISIKQLEILVQENEEQFQKTFMFSPNPITISAVSTGRILEINDKVTAKLGYSREDIIGRTAVEAGILSPGEYELLVNTLREQEGVENLEIKVNTREGVIRSILLSGCKILLKGQSCYILTFNDVTRWKQMETELMKSRTLESIGNLAGGIARDFNDFLTSIMGNISIARLSMHDVKKIHKALNRAESIAIKAAELASRLLTFSDGGSPFNKKCSLGEIVREVIEYRFKNSDAAIVNRSPLNLWNVMGDESQLHQLIYAIVLNAVEAMPDGGEVIITAKNTPVPDGNPMSLSPGKYVNVSISDTGMGIPEQDLDKVFDPFFSTKDTITRSGAGLGLSICRSIITKHNGYIGVASTEGKGTTVDVYIPAAGKD